MNKSVLQSLNRLLSGSGLLLASRAEVEMRNNELAAYTELLQLPVEEEYLGGGAQGVVFSRDRALQLHALLSSYREKVGDPVPLHILYYCSNPEHTKSYQELQDLHREQRITWLEQTSADSFRDQLLYLLDNLSAPSLFFLVDDLLFINDLKLSHFSSFNPRRVVPTLRLGSNIGYSYAMKRDLVVPPLQELRANPELRRFSWQDSRDDWAYPLSVDGHLFALAEMRILLKHCQFRAPNSLELALQQFIRIFREREGICYHKSRIVNIPYNRVQQELDNPHAGHDTQELLRKWQERLQLDHRAFYGVNNSSPHQEYPLKFISRD